MKKIGFWPIISILMTLVLVTDHAVEADVVIGSVPVGTTPGSIVVNPVTNMIYVSNINSANVTVINGSDNTATNIAVGDSPRNMAVNPITNKVYVPNAGSNSVTVIDGSNNSTVSIPVISQPTGIAVNTITNKIYVVNSAFNTPSNLTVIDGATNSTSVIQIGLTISSVVLNESTNKVYVGTRANNMIAVIDGSTNAVSLVPVGAIPGAMVVDESTNKIYVTNTMGGSVTVIDGADNTTTNVPVGFDPNLLALNPVTNTIYVGGLTAANLTVINGADNTTTMIPVNPQTGDIAVNPESEKIYVSERTNGNLRVINAETSESMTLPIGPTPGAIAINSSTKKIYVAVLGNRTVSIIDGALDPTPTPTPTPTPGDCTPLAEGFESLSSLIASGWVQTNNSSPRGSSNWFQGNVDVFKEHLGAPGSYVAANFENVSTVGTISNWLFLPAQTIADGDQVTFYTRTEDDSTFPDRLQVRMSTAGFSTDVGFGAPTVGDFTSLLLEVNPDLTVGGYPEEWTQFTASVTGVPVPTVGRLAFRYFVTSGGPNGVNSNYIGIDTLEYVCSGGDPEPTPTPTPSPTPITFVSVSGQVVTPDGRALAGAIVSITDSSGNNQITTSSTFGRYSFNDVLPGSSYSVRASSKLYRFSVQDIFVDQNMTNVDFIGVE